MLLFSIRKQCDGVAADGKWIRTIKGLSADSVRVINLADGKTY